MAGGGFSGYAKKKSTNQHERINRENRIAKKNFRT